MYFASIKSLKRILLYTSCTPYSSQRSMYCTHTHTTRFPYNQHTPEHLPIFYPTQRGVPVHENVYSTIRCHTQREGKEYGRHFPLFSEFSNMQHIFQNVHSHNGCVGIPTYILFMCFIHTYAVVHTALCRKRCAIIWLSQQHWPPFSLMPSNTRVYCVGPQTLLRSPISRSI